MKESIEVSIIGCGPAAMMIAHACDQHDIGFRIYGPGEPSFISGAQYLHRDVGVRYEGLKPETVKYVHEGSEAGYEQKIYGELPPDLVTSWGKFPDGDVEAWPLVGIYHHLWNRFEDRIIRTQVDLERVLELGDRTLCFCTAPIRALMPDADYKTERVAIVNGVSACPPFTIVYSGDVDVPWYRTSNLWENHSTEYPIQHYLDHMPDDPNARIIDKPLSTDAFIPNVILSGRYGRWEKGVLVDESYYQAIEAFRVRG